MIRRVVDLPTRGTLLVATDLQGNVRDFERLRQVFVEESRGRSDTFLVITGDLVHGPELSPEQWPEHLGSYYHGDSATLLEQAAELQRAFPGRVFYLLGNHEHAHIGGPVVGKFFPDEAARLEEIMGPARSDRTRAWLRTWPLVAVAPRAQLALLHGAPHALVRHRREIDAIDLDGLWGIEPSQLPSRSILGALLWARSASEARARAFLSALAPNLTTAIHGHDVAREGYFIEQPSHICVSSSFGCHDGDKLYVQWELSEPCRSAFDVADRGLRRLWPDALPVYLDATLQLA